MTRIPAWQLLIASLSLALSATLATAERPNIILMMSDDQGWGEVGYYDHPHVKTPVLDEMAAKGLRLDRFYSAAPVCSPTRASVMTGRHPNRSGVFTFNFALRPSEITVAQVLKEAGYRTGHFGKWHIGPVKAGSPNSPMALGFDEYLSHDNFYELDPPLSRNGTAPRIFKGEGSEIAVEHAMRFIDKNQTSDDPFFVVIWFGSPHVPYRGVARDLAHYSDLENEELKHRYAEITAMDYSIGLLRDHLDALGVADNTLLWFTSDNGDPVKSETGSYAGDLRDTKGSLHEGGIRVPAVIEWPAVVRRPARSSVPTVTSDIMPTLLDLLDLKHPDPSRPSDGISLKPLIVDGSMHQRSQPIGFWKYDRRDEAANGPWLDAESQRGTTPTSDKKAHGHGHRLAAGTAIDQMPDVGNPAIEFYNYRHPVAKTENFGGAAAWTDNRYKLIVTALKSGEEAVELFDVVADPFENDNLASKHPQQVQRMREDLDTWRASVEQSLTGADYR